MRYMHLGFFFNGVETGEAQPWPGKGWMKGGRKVRKVRQWPPFAHARGMKDGERVDERWEKPGNAHPLPMQGV